MTQHQDVIQPLACASGAVLAATSLRRIEVCSCAQDYAERRALRGELKALGKEERSRQQKAIAEARQACQLPG